MKTYPTYFYVLLTSIFSALLPEISNAEQHCINSTCFEKLIKKETDLSLTGSSIFEYFMIDVYAGALYSDKPITDRSSVFDENSSKFLILEYYVAIKKADFVASTKKILLKNKEIDQDKISKDFEAVYAAFKDVKPGDRYSLYYSSRSKVTCLALNGEDQVCGTGVEFFKAFFGIWISDYSVSEEFTKGLLGKP